VEAKPNSNSLRVDPPSVFFRTTLLLYLLGKPIVSNNKKQQQTTTTTTKSKLPTCPKLNSQRNRTAQQANHILFPQTCHQKRKTHLKHTHTYTKLRTSNCAIRYHTFLEGKNSTTFSHLLEPPKCGVISSMTVVVVVVVVMVMQQSTMLVATVPYVLGRFKPCLYQYRGCLNR
jgi:hypothetical protein